MPHAFQSFLMRIAVLVCATLALSLVAAPRGSLAAAEEAKAKAKPKKAPPREAEKAKPEAEAEAEEEEEEEEEAEEEEAEGEETKPGAGGAAAKKVKPGTTAVADPGVDQLAMLNAAEIFGGKLKISGDTFQVVFDGDGQMQRGFDGTPIVDTKSDQMKGANRKFLRLKDSKQNEPEILVPGLTAVGLGEGMWVSKFPVAGDVWIEFGFRVPNLIDAESNLRVRVNWNKEGKSGYETSFFQTISYLSNGITKNQRTTQLPQYKGLPMDWFQRQREPTKVEFGIREGKCLVRMGGKEMVAMSKVADKGGKVSFVYSKLLFTVDNLKISGKLDRTWLKKRLDELKTKKKLKTSPDPDPPPAGG